MLRAGISLLDALTIVRGVMQNSYIAAQLDGAKDAIGRGDTIAHAIRAMGLFAPIVYHTIAVGEMSGNLEEQLIHIADDYDSEVELAIRRILLVHGIILTTGGIPLIYLGDELGQLNDYSYQEDPDKAHDSRWVHRLRADPEKFARRHQPETIEGRIYGGLQNLIAMRKENSAFAGSDLEVILTQNPHVLGYVRTHARQQAFIFANFSDFEQRLPASLLEQGDCRTMRCLHGHCSLPPRGDLVLVLEPLDFVVVG